MFLILDYKNMITEISSQAVWINRLSNGYDRVVSPEKATAIYSEDSNSFYPTKKAEYACNYYTMVEVEDIPSTVTPFRYSYIDSSFVLNEKIASRGLSTEQRLSKLESALEALIGSLENRLNDETLSSQLRRAIQMYATKSLTDDSEMMEVADIYPSWEDLIVSQKTISAKTIFKWGVDSYGDTQLWRFVSDYKPDPTYTPDQDPTHYTKIGVTEDGYPEWVQPLGSTDAYELGDIVSHNGKLWICTQGDGGGKNVWEPGVYGWEVYTEE